MKSLKHISILIVMASLFSSCSSAQKLQMKSPIPLADVYCQKWVAGVKGGGSGINLFIPVANETPQNIQLDSVYFRGKGAKLELIQAETPLFVGRFETEFNQKQDIVMSIDPNEEYGNQAPRITLKIPFELKDSECVVSYNEGNDIKYFKIENITEKPAQNYPSSPSNKHE